MITDPPKKKPKIDDPAVMEFINRGMASPAKEQGKAKGKEGSAPRQVPISITMTPDFLERLDAAAKAMSMNRSAFVKMAVSAYLKTM